MRVSDMLSKAKVGSKEDDIPGTVEQVLEEVCPLCGRPMRKYKPCCGAKKGYIGCKCGYKVIL